MISTIKTDKKSFTKDFNSMLVDVMRDPIDIEILI